MQIQVNHVTSSGVQGGVGDVGWMPMVLVMTKNYLTFLACTTTSCYLRAILCKNQTKWEMKNFVPPTPVCVQIDNQII